MKFTLASIATVLVIATASANPILEKRTVGHKAVGVDVDASAKADLNGGAKFGVSGGFKAGVSGGVNADISGSACSTGHCPSCSTEYCGNSHC